MYSVFRSFVSVAIGLLIEDGLISFVDDRVTLCMTKTAKAFLDEYQGYAIGTRK